MISDADLTQILQSARATANPADEVWVARLELLAGEIKRLNAELVADDQSSDTLPS